MRQSMTSRCVERGGGKGGQGGENMRGARSDVDTRVIASELVRTRVGGLDGRNMSQGTSLKYMNWKYKTLAMTYVED